MYWLFNQYLFTSFHILSSTTDVAKVGLTAKFSSFYMYMYFMYIL